MTNSERMGIAFILVFGCLPAIPFVEHDLSVSPEGILALLDTLPNQSPIKRLTMAQRVFLLDTICSQPEHGDAQNN